MKYLVISGSHRKESQSKKVSDWLNAKLIERGNESEVIDLGGNPFPLWDESMWDSKSKLRKEMEPVLKKLTECNALIIVSPEWGGMAPAGLKNLLLYLGGKEVGHKPALLVSVSSGRGGAYPIAELRMSGYKNNKICFIPDHLIVRNVEDVMNDDDSKAAEKEDTYVRERAIFSLDVLENYAEALKDIRDKDVLWNDDYKYGM